MKRSIRSTVSWCLCRITALPRWSVSVSAAILPPTVYGDNERLAKARSGLLPITCGMHTAFPRPGGSFFGGRGLGRTVRSYEAGKPSWQDAVLRVIRRYGIFNGREKQLMDLEGGTPYREMMRRYFPKLRRIEVVVQYDVRKVEGDEAAELIYTHPDLLSLEEIYAVARYYRPGRNNTVKSTR